MKFTFFVSCLVMAILLELFGRCRVQFSLVGHTSYLTVLNGFLKENSYFFALFLFLHIFDGRICKIRDFKCDELVSHF